jgi:hypothetical protein
MDNEECGVTIDNGPLHDGDPVRIDVSVRSHRSLRTVR